MKREDERILEYLDSEGWATPDMIARNVFEKVSPDHAKERLLLMRDAGFVDNVWSDAYALSGDGRRYLSGDLDARHHRAPNTRRALHG